MEISGIRLQQLRCLQVYPLWREPQKKPGCQQPFTLIYPPIVDHEGSLESWLSSQTGPDPFTDYPDTQSAHVVHSPAVNDWMIRCPTCTHWNRFTLLADYVPLADRESRWWRVQASWHASFNRFLAKLLDTARNVPNCPSEFDYEPADFANARYCLEDLLEFTDMRARYRDRAGYPDSFYRTVIAFLAMLYEKWPLLTRRQSRAQREYRTLAEFSNHLAHIQETVIEPCFTRELIDALFITSL